MKFRFPLFLTVLLPVFAFGAGVPDNLGLGLKRLVENYQSDQVQFRATISAAKTVQADLADRVVVNIHLNGTKPLDDVKIALQGLGLEVIDVDPNWRSGVISAWLPIAQTIAVAELAGVRSVILAPPPKRRVGSVTAESSVVERAQQVNTPGLFTPQGILGTGISIGIVSDSYDTASFTPSASAGVSSGNLPGPSNPNGYTTPVVILADGTGSDSDEGRGMAEIVHDIAPAAKICFHGVGNTQTSFANAIRNLRTNSQTRCDIITDDIYFYEEPFFSDGPIAQAIDDVVTSNVLAGKKVVFFSSAGNDGNYAYSSDLNLVTAAQGTAAVDNLNFSTVPASLYAGGFHNLNPGGATKIAMTVKTESPAAIISFQWDDPFDAGAVTTNYNLLVFDVNGNYISARSGIDNNISTDEPIEFLNNLAANTTYQFVISIASPAPPNPPTATHLRFVSVSGDTLSGPYIAYNAASTFGHATAANANGVGAYVYSNTPDTTPSYNPTGLNPPPGPYRPAFEDFSSTGGSLSFYFDSSGNRLPSPDVRQKPEFCAADGVDTSFFGSDYDNNGFPNFFGTSAAAPTAAAIGALMLEAAGGPGSLTAAQMRALMQQSTFPHDLDPNLCNATTSNGVATVQVNANGNSSNDSANSSMFFTVSFSGNPGQTFSELVIDLTNTALVFDESGTGFAFTVGSNPNGVSINHTLSPDKRMLTLTFGNTFQPGETISFGIDRDFSAITASGNSADLLAGAKIKATVDSTTTLLGAFANQLGSGFTFADGFGLLDAQGAVASILGPLPKSTSVTANLSTRADTQTGAKVLIGGFIIQGPGTKDVIIRAIGPSLVNVSGALADPTLTLHDQYGTEMAFNDNWQDDPDQAMQIQDSGLAPTNPDESALAKTLVSAPYTAIVRGANSTAGVGLIEVYDPDHQSGTSQLANISTRAFVQTGNKVVIGGFIITGSQPTNVIVRGRGPSLPVAGSLPDPFMELRDSQQNLITSNDNWQQDSLQATQIQATGIAPTNALESAIVLSLNPGAYTAILRGANTTTGIGIVEVYNLQ